MGELKMSKNPVFLGVLLLVLLIISSTSRAAMEEQELVRIGLAFNQEEINLAADPETILIDLSNPEHPIIPWPGDQALVTMVSDTIHINEIPISSGPLLLSAANNSLLTWDGRVYRGEFLIIKQNGKLNLINRLALEDYLRGVVPKEIPAGWPMAALKAQAIAARTYTLANLGRHREDEAHLCAGTHCQVYQGVTGEHSHTDRAVRETSRMIITYQGKLISAVYHDSSGGYTKDASEVWSQPVPYLTPAPGWDSNSPYNQWTRSFSWEELQFLIEKSYPEIGELRQILPAGFSGDGRIIKLILKGAQAEANITGEQFRHATGIPSSNMELGFVYRLDPLISLWWLRGQERPKVFTAEAGVIDGASATAELAGELADPWLRLQDEIPVRLEIRGAGRGHGVGLSQWGAKGMAEAGYNEEQILEHFYPGATVMKMATNLENEKLE